jgi:hypothetical protein
MEILETDEESYSNNNFENMIVAQLKVELKNRGLSPLGKKDELLHRLRSSSPDSSPFSTPLKEVH